jgi:putative addiction module component (TIGR02574 family)
MTTLLDELEQRARALAPQDRAHLVEVLLESLYEPAEPEVAQAWHEEIENRVAAYDKGAAQTSSAEAVFAQARRLLRTADSNPQ